MNSRRVVALGLLAAALLSAAGCVNPDSGPDRVESRPVPSWGTWHYHWGTSSPDSNSLQVVFQVREKTRIFPTFFHDSVWDEARMYWVYAELIDWTSSSSVLRSWGITESSSSCPRNDFRDFEACPERELRGGGNSSLTLSLSPGTYALAVMAYGATTAPLVIDAWLETNITILTVGDGYSQLRSLWIPAGESSRNATFDLDIAAPFHLRLLEREGSVYEYVVRLEGQDDRRITRTINTSVPRWVVDPPDELALNPMTRGLAGNWNLDVHPYETGPGGVLVLAGIALSPAFLLADGRMMALGPGVFAPTDWRPDGPPL